jgi:hypothetical protein
MEKVWTVWNSIRGRGQIVRVRSGYGAQPASYAMGSGGQSQSHFTADSQSVSQSVCLGVGPILWTFDQILLPFQEFGSEICYVSVGRPL